MEKNEAQKLEEEATARLLNYIIEEAVDTLGIDAVMDLLEANLEILCRVVVSGEIPERDVSIA